MAINWGLEEAVELLLTCEHIDANILSFYISNLLFLNEISSYFLK